jgi:RES domain-containing protein
MELWRISIYPDLSGVGGLRAAGRWHTRGKPVVYLADHSSSALLEMLVHLDRDMFPSAYQLLRIRAPATVTIDEVDAAVLSQDWQDRPDITRRIGDAWLNEGSGALLRVPSAILPHASNFLLNPAHAAASSVNIVETIMAPFDPRLWRPR